MSGDNAPGVMGTAETIAWLLGYQDGVGERRNKEWEKRAKTGRAYRAGFRVGEDDRRQGVNRNPATRRRP